MGLPKSGENSTFNYLINLINLLFDFLINDIKIYWVKVISSKDCDFWTTQGWEINFFRQNIGMFEWLCTQTYLQMSPNYNCVRPGDSFIWFDLYRYSLSKPTIVVISKEYWKVFITFIIV